MTMRANASESRQPAASAAGTADVTAEEARQQLAEIEALYQTAPVGLCLLDTKLRWVRLNERMAEMNGFPVAAHLGRTPRELLPDLGGQAEAALRRVIETGETVEVEISGTTAAQPGVQRVWSERWAPVRDVAGRTIAVSVVAEEITDRRRAEQALRESEETSRAAAEELRAAKEMLVRADRRKDEFLAIVSHELRNPLASIRNSLYILEQVEQGGDLALRARGVIARQAALMTRIVDDLLDLTRVSRGKLDLQRQRVELHALLQSAVDDHRAAFVAKGVSLAVDVPPAPVCVLGDPARLAQVAGNLLTNAAKFTPNGGHVAVSLRAEGAMAVLTVGDDGAGIAPEALGRVFQPFVQEEGTRDRSHGGLGLGLALVKALVEVHGGTVAAASEGRGRGAEFTVRLPLAAPEAADR